jgi:hypothetical protein
MKREWAALALVLVTSLACGQPGGLTNAEIKDRESVSDPVKVMREAEGGWLAFSMPVLEGTRQPCCWQGKWSSSQPASQELGCYLDRQMQSYGSHSDSPLAENVIVYMEIGDGQVRTLRVLGEKCPVKGGGDRVTWIGQVGEKAGLDWLEQLSHTSAVEAVAGTALYALSVHQSDKATDRLTVMALQTDGELQNEAVFWLGESRGANGLEALEQLLAELPRGDVRREINFALSLNGTDEAIELLSDISRHDTDPEQRANALFWLASEFPGQAPGLLMQAIEHEQDEDVLEQAVFAVSQLPDHTATALLLELATDPSRSREVRRQALFWLANSDDDEAIAALVKLLSQ